MLRGGEHEEVVEQFLVGGLVVVRDRVEPHLLRQPVPYRLHRPPVPLLRRPRHPSELRLLTHREPALLGLTKTPPTAPNPKEPPAHLPLTATPHLVHTLLTRPGDAEGVDGVGRGEEHELVLLYGVLGFVVRVGYVQF